MKLFFLGLFFCSTTLNSLAMAKEEKGICSRTAEINYQEVIVDTVATKRAEGLRFYLEKDPEAKAQLDLYQKKTAPIWQQAALGTIGTGMFLGGLFYSDNDRGGLLKKSNLLITGTSLIIINALIYNTSQRENETVLQQAVEKYNQRNHPQILFSPFQNQDEESTKSENSLGVFGGLSKDF